MSIFGQVGLYAQAYDPTIVLGTSYSRKATPVRQRITEALLSYSHQKDAQGGWTSAQLSFRATEDEANDWFEYGLNRHVEICNSAHIPIFAGFVNIVTVSRGTLTSVRGPVTDIMNRASVTYTPILSTATAPPIYGVQRPTTIADDDDSREKYGTWEKVLQGGRVLPTGATQYRDSELARLAWPRTSQQISLEAQEVNVVSLEILGYYARLGGWIYQDLTAGTRQADTRMQDIFADEPDSLFDTTGVDIAANATLVSRWEDTASTAMDAIQAVLKYSDAANQTWYVGVKDITPYYWPEPTEPLYQHRIVGPEITIEEYLTESNIYPWDLESGEWMFLTGLLVGRQPETSIYQDPRFQFIEQVRYTAPWGLEVNGERVTSMGQAISEKGMF